MILQNLLQKLDSDTLLILDIDSTLVQTHHRNQAILEAYCAQKEPRFPQDIPQIQKMRCQANDYGYYSALERAGVEFSSTSAKDDLQAYWRERFFGSDYLHHDTAMAGAKKFVETLQQEGHNYVYLTGRYKLPMLKGTKSSFELLGFPFTEDQLILKEDPAEQDDLYKSRVVAGFEKQYKKVIIIDNEPVILQRMAKDHPKVENIWFESTHSGRMKPPEGVATIRSFEI